jgi:hypothetical protein
MVLRAEPCLHTSPAHAHALPIPVPERPVTPIELKVAGVTSEKICDTKTRHRGYRLYRVLMRSPARSSAVLVFGIGTVEEEAQGYYG